MSGAGCQCRLPVSVWSGDVFAFSSIVLVLVIVLVFTLFFAPKTAAMKLSVPVASVSGSGGDLAFLNRYRPRFSLFFCLSGYVWGMTLHGAPKAGAPVHGASPYQTAAPWRRQNAKR